MNTAHFWQNFDRLFVWSLESLALPPVMLLETVCIVSTVSALVRQRPFRTGAWRFSYWLMFTQLLFFPLIVAVGALFPAISGWPHPKANPIGNHLLDILFFLSLATCAFWVYRMKGLRWLSASLLAVQEVALLGAGFIAGMSVGGDWI
jgi:hypothetical protein